MDFDGHKSGNTDTAVSEVKVVESNWTSMRYLEVILRILGLLVTLVAAIVVGVDKETTTVSFTLFSSLPPLHVPVTAKWNYMSAFVYLLVSNAIACSYAAGSLAYALAARSAKENTKIELVILDVVIMGLLFSANGAAASIGLIGHYGNSHVHWNKVCNAVSGFCHQMGAAFVLSLVGSFVFLWLVVLAVFRLHKKTAST